MAKLALNSHLKTNILTKKSNNNLVDEEIEQDLEWHRNEGRGPNSSHFISHPHKYTINKEVLISILDTIR